MPELFPLGARVQLRGRRGPHATLRGTVATPTPLELHTMATAAEARELEPADHVLIAWGNGIRAWEDIATIMPLPPEAGPLQHSDLPDVIFLHHRRLTDPELPTREEHPS